MCGIVGYIGPKAAQPILLSGLKRLEYRGYDSAGIATLAQGDATIVKEKGKVDLLGKALKKAKRPDRVGIGHTRWATHGHPSQANAHPHQAGAIILVHNGIIENYEELKEELVERGAKFESQTDTEVMAWLIAKAYEEVKDFKAAVEEALELVRGTFGLAILCTDEPGTVIAARRGSPLIIGLNKKEAFVASDATALVGRAKQVIYLNDDELAVLKPGKADVFEIGKGPRIAILEELELEVETIQKGGYDHFLLKEIMEQPDSVREILRGHLLPATGEARLGGLNLTDKQIKAAERIQIIGCGTAYYAGLMAKYQLEKMTGLAVDVEVASEFRYRQPVLAESTIAAVISQSGETADTFASLEELKRRGVHTLGFVNAVGSSIARAVDGGIYLHAGPEISVASTKAFTSQVLAAMLFGLYVGRRRGLSEAEGKKIVRALEKLPAEIEKALQLNDEIKQRAQALAKFDHALYLGRDTLYPIALEGALKLKEVSYIHAEGYPAGEMKHGPIALIDDRFLVVGLLAKGAMAEKSVSNYQEVLARHGHLLLVTDDKKIADKYEGIYVPTSSDWTKPLVMNVALQLLAYHMSVARGTDVDQPRNLAKSVTVE